MHLRDLVVDGRAGVLLRLGALCLQGGRCHWLLLENAIRHGIG